MAWTAPMTAIAGNAFTAAQFNTHIRDNLLETAPAKATASGRYMVTTGANAIAERVPSEATIATSQDLSTTGTWTDLPTPGPTVTVTTGSKALVIVGADLSRDAASATSSVRMSFAVSGATTIAAGFSTNFAGAGLWQGNGSVLTGSRATLLTNLTPGSNTFTAKYYVSAATGTFSNRQLIVLPF